MAEAETQITSALSRLFEPGDWVELRALGKYRKFVKSGYYNDFGRLAHDASVLDRSGEYKGIYVVLNKIDEELRHRAPNCLNKESGPATTSDADIVSRVYLPLDFDPKRKAEISASEEEHTSAIDRAIKVREYLRESKFPDPILADSGNGGHLLYKIDLPNDKESTTLIESFMKAVAFQFTDNKVEVDLKMFNAARICKLPGTVTRKGEQSEDRVWRRASIIESPEKLEVVPRALLEREVWAWKQAVEPDDVNDNCYQPGAIKDLAQWLKDHNLSWSKTKGASNGGISYVLDQCPSCGNTDNCCHVSQYPPPKNGFHASCKHNHCDIKDWATFRKTLEPDYVPYAEREQSKQDRDQNRRTSEELPELELEDLCVEHTVNEGKSNERTDYKFSPEKAADTIVQRYDIVTTEDDKIWVYRNGYYSTEWWKGITDLVNNVAGDHFPTNMKKELEAKVQSKSRVKESIFYEHPYLLCCKNVTVDLLTGKILEHSPEHYLNSPSAFVYNSNAWPTAFIQLLEESCSNDIDRMTLIDWIVATCCLVEFEYILFMTGNGSNGKRMYEDVLKAIFPGFTEHIGLEEMNKSKFAKAQLKVARTNVFNETNVDWMGTETIKSLSGGDEQSGDVKNEKQRTKWRSFTQLIFDTNGMPRFMDPSYGFKRRFTRVKMMFTFRESPNPTNPLEKKADPTLGERLISEENLSGILNLVIARAVEIAKLKKICRRDDDFDEYEEDTHSFNNFVEKFIRFDVTMRNDPEFRIASSELFKHFDNFTDYGGRKMSQFSFSRRVGMLNRQPSTTLEGLPPYRGFKGLFFDKEKFDQYIKAKMNGIYISNDCNDSLTSCNEENTDTVTSITSYSRILHIVEGNTIHCLGGKSERVVVGELVTDSDSVSPKPITVTPIQGGEKQLVSQIEAELEQAEAATQAKEEHFDKIAKPKLGMVMVTKDCELNGTKYKVGDVVHDEMKIIRQLTAKRCSNV